MNWKSLARHPLQIIALAALATLPTELLSDFKGWSVMDPQSYLAEALWFPIFTLCQLALLRRFGQNLNPEAGKPALRGGALLSAIGAEILLGLRFCTVILAWALPTIVVLSIFGLEPAWAPTVLGLMALLSAIPCVLWILRRLFAPAVILWQGLGASESLRESARLTEGKLRKVLWPLIALNGIALILEGLSSLLEAGSLATLPLSFILSSLAIAWSYRILTL